MFDFNIDDSLVFFSHVRQRNDDAIQLVERQARKYGYDITDEYDEFNIDVYLLQDQPMSRHIALDWDNTFNVNKDFFLLLTLKLVQAGYEPCICSLRAPDRENMQEICGVLEEAKIAIYLTDGKPKREYLAGLDVEVNLWIDDFYPGICGDDCSLLLSNHIS